MAAWLSNNAIETQRMTKHQCFGAIAKFADLRWEFNDLLG